MCVFGQSASPPAVKHQNSWPNSYPARRPNWTHWETGRARRPARYREPIYWPWNVARSSATWRTAPPGWWTKPNSFPPTPESWWWRTGTNDGINCRPIDLILFLSLSLFLSIYTYILSPPFLYLSFVLSIIYLYIYTNIHKRIKQKKVTHTQKKNRT